MKYMGSKRTMLMNGLGKLLMQQAQTANRIVDLFSGAGYVAWYIAEHTDKAVLAVDLQAYATILAEAIIGRTYVIDPISLKKSWLLKTIEKRDNAPLWREANRINNDGITTKEWVGRSRQLCQKPSDIGPIWNAYGGHYFSPAQALTFDYLLAHLPGGEPERTVCQAACISAATGCAASPGHTAQPFQPTDSAGPFIVEAWNKDPILYCQKALEVICPRHARIVGDAVTVDALFIAKEVKENDLVFIDPPYSSVQYSRFYHVLETIASGQKHISVSGAGRYPSIHKRPQSKFSSIGQSQKALEELLRILGTRGCNIIFTFPSGYASNGLSGDYIKHIAGEWFCVEDHSTVEGQFSTLGGNNTQRDARKKSRESIFLMKPKNQHTKRNNSKYEGPS